MCSFILILIRAVTNEVKTAQVAYWIQQNITRNHFTFWLTDTASSWLDRKTTPQLCEECGEYTIGEEFPDLHDACLEKLCWLDQQDQAIDAAWERTDPTWPVSKRLDAVEKYLQEDPYEDLGFGHCLRCGQALEESEWAIGDYCSSCLPVFLEEWDAQQEAKAEAAEEARRYPEDSDDEDGYCPYCDRQYGDCRSE